MGLLRSFVPYESQFTQLPNRWLRDERLSRRAKGLLAEVMSHRIGWRVSVAGLQKVGPEGRDAIRTTIAELLDCGYLRRVQERGDQGRFNEVEYEVCDPFTADGKSGTGGFTGAGSPDVGSPDVGKSDPIEEHPLEDHREEEQKPLADQSAGLFEVGAGELTSPYIDRQFERAWKAYPNPNNKKQARAAWTKAIKRIDIDLLVQRIEEFGAAWAATGKSASFTPYLQKWLNEDRWENPLPVVEQQQQRSPGQEALDIIELGRQMAEQEQQRSIGQ